MRSIQQRFQKMMGFAPCVFYGRGLTSVRSRGFLPYARPITTVGEHLQRVSWDLRAWGGGCPVPRVMLEGKAQLAALMS